MGSSNLTDVQGCCLRRRVAPGPYHAAGAAQDLRCQRGQGCLVCLGPSLSLSLREWLAWQHRGPPVLQV
jgi:hypothetical protein